MARADDAEAAEYGAAAGFEQPPDGGSGQGLTVGVELSLLRKDFGGGGKVAVQARNMTAAAPCAFVLPLSQRKGP